MIRSRLVNFLRRELGAALSLWPLLIASLAVAWLLMGGTFAAPSLFQSPVPPVATPTSASPAAPPIPTSQPALAPPAEAESPLPAETEAPISAVPLAAPAGPSARTVAALVVGAVILGLIVGGALAQLTRRW